MCFSHPATLLTYKHDDSASLAEQLDRAAGRRTLVVVDAVFSMDGDIVDLPAVVELCQRHDVLLMVDEAHSLGVLGKTGLEILVSVRNAIGGADHGQLREGVEREFRTLNAREQSVRSVMARMESGFIRRFAEFHHE